MPKQRSKRQRLSKLLIEVRNKKKKPTLDQDSDGRPVDILADFDHDEPNEEMSTSSDSSDHLESECSNLVDDQIPLPECWSQGKD